MKRSHAVTLAVAHWEFRRYFKPRQQLISMAIFIVAGLIGLTIGRLNRDRGDALQIGVTGSAALPLSATITERFALIPLDAVDPHELRSKVETGELDALLLIAGPDEAELVVLRARPWVGELQTALAEARQQLMMQRAGLTPDVLATILARPRVAVHEIGGGRISGSDRLFFLAAVGFMLLAVFTGLSYIFASITGEKQLRVTEQVLASIPAQHWIDGKILGIAFLAVVTTLGTALSTAVLIGLVQLAGFRMPMPESFGNPFVVATTILFTVLGLFLWLSFLAALASMIDDPHTSARGAFLMLPVVATSTAFFAVSNPDGTLVRVLSFLPPTAPAMLPARLLMTHVPLWEIALALAALVAACLLLRTAAGRVFRLAMLMYGKEPSWAEVRRWVASAGASASRR